MPSFLSDAQLRVFCRFVEALDVHASVHERERFSYVVLAPPAHVPIVLDAFPSRIVTLCEGGVLLADALDVIIRHVLIAYEQLVAKCGDLDGVCILPLQPTAEYVALNRDFDAREEHLELEEQARPCQHVQHLKCGGGRICSLPHTSV